MESKLAKLGGSLTVPYVQELAKEISTTIPERYIRFDENESISSNISFSSEIPVIDMNELDGDSKVELGKLHVACQEWGFFQLINHGVDSQLVQNMKLEILKFFSLPIEEKKRFYQEEGDVQGYGQVFVVSEEQKLDWGDMFYAVTLPTYLRANHLIPQFPHKFRDAIEAYSAAMKILAMKILYLMAKDMEMKEEDMKILFEEGMQAMRMNYYPPCPQPELVTGLSPHSDTIGLTILSQVNEVEGLQVKKDGVWIPVFPLPDAFVINVGDILEIVTNGAYRSIEHRAVVNTEQERLTMVTFLSPKLGGDLGPAPSLITPENPAKFKRIGVSDYFKGLLTRELAGKSYLDTMRI
ncbi:oxoglutarate-dependent flavonoid 7-O-demethylase 1-like [Primulina huaijiensis]|uniref:oxoglutarate-dependent flavonoid 7-O-demethylase 1-like n=1 Tax=Primulina huaijiensis TaxID=1492673 RepID=UPI003CC790AD